MCSSRRAARAVASLPTMTAAASRRSCPRRRCPNRPATDFWNRPGSSQAARSRRVATTGRPEAIGQRAAAHRVVDGAGGPSPLGSPGGPDGRTAQEERVDGHRRGSQQAGRWQLPAPDDLEVLVLGGRVVEVGADQERERFAGQRRGVEGAEQPVEVGGRERCPLGCLERPGVEDDADARHALRRCFAKAGVGRPGRSGHARVTTRRPADGAASGRSPRPATGRRRPAPRRRSAGSSSTARRGGRGT